MLQMTHTGPTPDQFDGFHSFVGTNPILIRWLRCGSDLVRLTIDSNCQQIKGGYK